MGVVGRAVIAVLRAALRLVVDDGAVAVGIVAAVAAAAALSQPSLLGSRDAVGWTLLALLWAALGWSIRRVSPRTHPRPSQNRHAQGPDLDTPF